MRASAVTQNGVPTSEGGRACEFRIGDVKVFLTGPETDETRFVADSLRAYWNADCEPEGPRYTSAADDVAALCARLLRGPVTSPSFSVGPWTPAVADGFSWAVLDKLGAPLLLAHDAFEVALYFCRLEEGTAEIEGFVIEAFTDAALADRIRWDRWFEEHRFRGPMGDRNFTPPNPYEEAR